jgi:hypothetical protein
MGSLKTRCHACAATGLRHVSRHERVSAAAAARRASCCRKQGIRFAWFGAPLCSPDERNVNLEDIQVKQTVASSHAGSRAGARRHAPIPEQSGEAVGSACGNIVNSLAPVPNRLIDRTYSRHWRGMTPPRPSSPDPEEEERVLATWDRLRAVESFRPAPFVPDRRLVLRCHRAVSTRIARCRGRSRKTIRSRRRNGIASWRTPVRR